MRVSDRLQEPVSPGLILGLTATYSKFSPPGRV